MQPTTQYWVFYNSWFIHTHTTLNGKVRVYVCSYIGCLRITVLKFMLSCLLSHSITHLMIHMHTHACTHARTACMHEHSMNHTEDQMLSMCTLSQSRSVSQSSHPSHTIIQVLQHNTGTLAQYECSMSYNNKISSSQPPPHTFTHGMHQYRQLCEMLMVNSLCRY